MFVQLVKKFYSSGWELGAPSTYNDLAMDWKIWRARDKRYFQTSSEPIQPPIQWTAGALSSEVKLLLCEAAQLPSYSPKVKNEWSYITTPV
jgi:hypothetical protein